LEYQKNKEFKTKIAVMNKKDTTKESERDYASQNYPGAAINEGDEDKNNVKLQKERTCVLGNNPRNQK
jgi:hypothetical protein